MRPEPTPPLLPGWLSLALFVLLVLGGGTVIAMTFVPGDWYATLEKPFFTPPNWLFGPVWSLLYVMIAVAGWRTWQRSPAGLPMQVWFGQLALNFMWTSVFFGLHQPALGFLVIVIMVALIILFMRLTWNHDRVSAVLFMPYLAWTAFAAVLNGGIWGLN